MKISENITRIISQVPSSVRLIAVSKQQSVEKIKEAYNSGIRDFAENRLQEALEKTPKFWGIVVAYEIRGIVKFKYVRKTSTNPFFNKELALATLWKSELTNVNEELSLDIPEKINKRDFALELSERMNKIQTNRWIAESLLSRLA